MSKQAMGEVVKAAALIVTAVIYVILLGALIAPGRAFSMDEAAFSTISVAALLKDCV